MVSLVHHLGAGVSPIVAPVLSLHEDDLLQIFSFLSTRDLLNISRVCRQWYKLSFDYILWKNVDLKRFASRLTDPVKLDFLILKRFSRKIQWLDLSGLMVCQSTLRILSLSCKQLKILILKSVTFTSDSSRKNRFPSHLEFLDIRFSQGQGGVYREIASSLDNIAELGLCDAFLYTLLKDGSLETAIDGMKTLRQLDLSHCQLLKDKHLALFARCSQLEVLSLRKCLMLSGSFIQDFLQSCAHLKILVLEGISIDDDTMNRVRWDSCCLAYLELRWLPLITSRGLKSVLRQVTKIQTLEYLGLCAIGDGKALSDELLVHLAVILSTRSSKKLKWLNLSGSQCITRDGLDGLYTLIETIAVTNCPAVKPSVVASMSDGNACQTTDCTSFLGDGTKTKRNYFGNSNVFRFKWILETPV